MSHFITIFYIRHVKLYIILDNFIIISILIIPIKNKF